MPEVQLLQAFVLILLVLDVFAYDGLVSSDRRHEKTSCPEALAYEVSSFFSVHARQMNGALSFDKTDHLRDRMFRRNRDHHMHVICQQTPLLDPAFLLCGQLPEYLSKVRSQL